MTREEGSEPGAHIVQPGSRVRYRVGDAEPQVVVIFNPQEPTVTGTIQADSPLGKALMGRREGDEVDVELHPKLPMHRATIEAME